jgi:hypothetical protein
MGNHPVKYGERLRCAFSGDGSVSIHAHFGCGEIEKRMISMPRYLIERTFPDGLHVPMNDAGADALGGVIMRNAEKGVTWVQSFVSPDKKRSFCIYDAPSPEAIRSTAQKNPLPVDKITEVRILDPYFYR